MYKFLYLLKVGNNFFLLYALFLYLLLMGRDSVVGIATSYEMDGPGTESR
jgi:hypothetical protein